MKVVAAQLVVVVMKVKCDKACFYYAKGDMDVFS